MSGPLSFYCYLTFAILVGWCGYRLVFGSRNFDSLTFFYFFALFFFGIAPLVQYIQGLTLAPMYNEELCERDFLKLNLILIAVLAVFEVVYRFVFRCSSVIGSEIVQNYGMVSLGKILIIVALVLAIFLWYQDFNLQNVFLRGGDEEQLRNDDNKMVGLLCGKFLRYIPMSIATLYWMYGKSRVVSWLLLLVGVFCCFPLGMARLQIAPVYLPFLMVAIPRLRRMRRFLISSFVFAILFVFPVLHLFREKEVDLTDFSFFDFSFLNKLHFDSFASFAYVVKQDFIVGPSQLIGSILFWFPRSLWSEKPIESGRLMAETFDLGMGEFTNLAVNFFAEGYMNFGYIGILIFAIAVAAICAYLDKRFWADENNFNRPFVLYYFSWITILFFLLRGDMMSGVAFTMGLMVAHKVSIILTTRRI